MSHIMKMLAHAVLSSLVRLSGTPARSLVLFPAPPKQFPSLLEWYWAQSVCGCRCWRADHQQSI